MRDIPRLPFAPIPAPKRLLVGSPLRTASISEQLLPKWLALPVFCSDPISSVAYATQEMMIVLGLAGAGLLGLSLPLGLAIAALLVVVILSYRQICWAYPDGGGAYVVSRANVGRRASLVAASALLVDYVLTVAVSVVAGVDAITSYIPSLDRRGVSLSLGSVAVLTLANLRGVREASRGFAIPTYGFVLIIYTMFAVAAWKLATNQPMHAVSADFRLAPAHGPTGTALAFLVLRAFASGSTALTGVEAITNGIPAFRPPKARNAAATLAILGALAVTMFLGTTAPAQIIGVQMAERPDSLLGAPPGYVEPTALAQIGRAVFGGGVLYALLQAFTAAILVLAANTAFNGFPVLASILARDGYLPRQLHNRGDRLVFSNGIVLLAMAAGGLIWVFDADVTRLIHLYIVGVFVSFTLAQVGMVRHWSRATVPHVRRRRAINLVGAVATAVVLAVVVVTKFTVGAWIALVVMGGLFLVMSRIRRYYELVQEETRVTEHPPLPAHNDGIVLVSKVHMPTLRALAYARSTRPDTLTALTVQIDQQETAALVRQWDAMGIDVPLRVLDSPYREVTRPVVEYVRSLRRQSPRDVVTVFVPEYVAGRWWAQLLHNQSALRIKGRLLSTPGVVVTSVPYQLRSAIRVPADGRERHSLLLAMIHGETGTERQLSDRVPRDRAGGAG